MKLKLILGISTMFFFSEVSAQVSSNAYVQKIDGTKVSFEMKPIPAGTFIMGSDKGKKDETPTRKVQLDPFWMSTYEITWDVYELFVYKDYELSNNEGDIPSHVDAVTRPTKPYLDMTFGMGKENYPALAMTHYNAIQFCKWLYARTGVFYRLPTEAEWEYASRAGTNSDYFFGESTEILGDYAWYKSNGNGKTHEVGKKKPNQWGLYDMYGNVAEWTFDQYQENFYAEDGTGKTVSINPVAKPEKLYAHVIRGGSYEDEALNLRSSARSASDPAWKQIDPQIPKSRWWFPEAPFIGIRLVRPVKTPSKQEIENYYNIQPINDF